MSTRQIISTFLQMIDQLGLNFVQTVYQKLAGEVTGLFRAMLLVYVVWWGYEVLFGQASILPLEAARRLGRALFIYVLATQWGAFSTLVYDGATKIPESVGLAIMQSAGGGAVVNGSGVSALAASLDVIYDAGEKLAGQIYVGSMFDIIGALFAIVVVVAMFCFTVVAAGIIMASKILMFIVLSLAPVFVILALFKVSLPYTHGFIKVVVGFMIAMIITYGFLGFYAQAVQKVVAFAAPSSDASVQTRVGQILPFVFVCLVGFYIIIQIQTVANAISGSIAGGVYGGVSAAMGWSRAASAPIAAAGFRAREALASRRPELSGYRTSRGGPTTAQWRGSGMDVAAQEAAAQRQAEQAMTMNSRDGAEG
ncbi:MAG: type IV secretion system protein [Hyphomicrobiales bacterium]|nr:type IV secretion system protein [Hyphomicrobiales bacterium]MCC2106595.1 type IV secretion system protein [Hyphomicrobiales bacterium]